MDQFGQFSGVITSITDFSTTNEQTAGCTKFISVSNRNRGPVNFVVTPLTYFVDQVMVKLGDSVTGFYDATAPTPLIYPPQYQALVMAKASVYRNVKVDHFDMNLVSSDGSLKLNIGPYTKLLLENGQAFTGNPRNRDLIVTYGAATRSIPAQTTPYKIIVMCRSV